jgi:drug/metabolite transporter (DMT)-like permease
MKDSILVQKQTTAVSGHAAGSISGWIEAGLYVLAIALVSVTYAVAIAAGAHVVVFIVYSLLISAIGMLAITGPGPEAARIMLAPQSWLVGISNMMLEGAYCLMLATVSPAEGNLLVRLSIPLALAIGWLVFGRRPGAGVILGAAIIILGVGALAFTLDPVSQGVGVAYGLIAALFVSVRGFATEFHPWNRSARNVMEKMRVTGLVVLVTGLASLTAVVIAASLVGNGTLERSELLPAPADLWHWPTAAIALLVGGAIFTAMNYLQFSSVVKIRTENFIAMGAFMPLATLLLQMAAAAVGLIAIAQFDWRLLPGMLAVVAGVMVLIRARRHAA